MFGLPIPEMIRSDNALYHRHYGPHRLLYDAIVCYPPYRIWVGARNSANIRGCLIEAAKLRPGYEDKAVWRRQKRKATKQAKNEQSERRMLPMVGVQKTVRYYFRALNFKLHRYLYL